LKKGETTLNPPQSPFGKGGERRGFMKGGKIGGRI